MKVRHETADGGRIRLLAWYEPTPEAVARARKDVAAVCLTDTPNVDQLVVMTSELCSNVVAHAHTEFRVKLRDAGRWLHLSVTDRDRATAGLSARTTPELLSASGRGLLLVNGFADSWGWRVSGFGKTVWVRVPKDVNGNAGSPRRFDPSSVGNRS